MATSAGGGWDTKRGGNVPALRKDATSLNTAIEPEAKRVQSLCPLEASLASPPAAPSVAGRAGRSEERARTPTSSGSVRAREPQWGDAPSVAPVGASRADGRGHSRADQEPVGSAPPSVDMRGRGM